MILWTDPDDEQRVCYISISDADRAGWHEALVKFPDKEDLKLATSILKEQGYTRPNDRWGRNSWHKEESTYMRKTETYWTIKMRKGGENDGDN